MERYLAIDIGASSGRHIVGWQEKGIWQTQEVYRFPNSMAKQDGHLAWDLDGVFAQVLAGLRAALDRYGPVKSLAIDTWGVDYVLLQGETPIRPCYAYRDDRTKAVVDRVHGRISFETLYARTGTQYQPFNTLYQLAADQAAGRLEGATDFLMIPEYLTWRLTGRKCREYTNATTTGLVRAETGAYDGEVISALGLPEQLFKPLSPPGTLVGPLLPDVAEQVGGQCDVVLCASHDTASAVEGMELLEDELFLSSGTWSLLGAKLPRPRTDEGSRQENFTNEGGVGYFRYLKNIMGMWPIQELQKQWGLDFSQMTDLARQSSYQGLLDVNDPSLTAPENMEAALRRLLDPQPESRGDLLRAVYRSLAQCYAKTIRELEENTGKTWPRLVIAGGGAKNGYLNELTARMTGKQILPKPIEATALGNLMVQERSSRHEQI